MSHSIDEIGACSSICSTIDSYVCMTPPSVVDVWSMAVLLWQLIKCLERRNSIAAPPNYRAVHSYGAGGAVAPPELSLTRYTLANNCDCQGCQSGAMALQIAFAGLP